MPLPFFILLVLVNAGIVVGVAVQWYGHLSFGSGFFGVTVDAEFSRTEDAQRIVWRYRRRIIVMAGLCIAALWLVVPHLNGAAPLACLALTFISVSAGSISMAAAHRHVRAFAKPAAPAGTRTASLLPRKQTLPGGVLPFVGPMLIVGAAFLMIFTRRALMPPETYRRAVVLLLLPFVTNVFYMLVAGVLVFRTRPTDKQKEYWFRLLVAYFLTVLMVATPLVLAGIATPVMTSWVLMVLTALWFVSMTIKTVSYEVSKWKRALRTPGAAPPGDTTPEECWKFGFIYYNSEDPALLVEARAGRIGWNFGNNWSWAVLVALAAIFATPFLALLLSL